MRMDGQIRFGQQARTDAQQRLPFFRRRQPAEQCALARIEREQDGPDGAERAREEFVLAGRWQRQFHIGHAVGVMPPQAIDRHAVTRTLQADGFGHPGVRDGRCAAWRDPAGAARGIGRRMFMMAAISAEPNEGAMALPITVRLRRISPSLAATVQLPEASSQSAVFL
jgi:hypothetical protein